MEESVVQWLLENLISEPYSEADFEHNSDCWDKAEQMEKDKLERLKDFDTWKEWKNTGIIKSE
jgi:hypothetical protein